MRTPYYREQALEGIAREVITAYDPNLYYGVPRMIPIEDIIEAQGITLEYQCLRKTGCVLGETIFDDGGAIIYDYDIPGYTVIAVKSGTILIDSSLCREDASTGRLRFTCAHELAHWLLHTFWQAELIGKIGEGFGTDADGGEDTFLNKGEHLDTPFPDSQADFLDRNIDWNPTDEIIAGKLRRNVFINIFLPFRQHL